MGDFDMGALVGQRITPKTGFVMLPNGVFVPEAFGNDLLRAGDFEFENAQESYLLGETTAIDDDCVELVRLVERGQWDEADDVFETVLGRLEDVHVGHRATRHRLDRLSEEFQRALEFIEKVKFAAVWIPADDALLTPTEFEFVDRKVVEVALPLSFVTNNPQTKAWILPSTVENPHLSLSNASAPVDRDWQRR